MYSHLAATASGRVPWSSAVASKRSESGRYLRSVGPLLENMADSQVRTPSRSSREHPHAGARHRHPLARGLSTERDALIVSRIASRSRLIVASCHEVLGLREPPIGTKYRRCSYERAEYFGRYLDRLGPTRDRGRFYIQAAKAEGATRPTSKLVRRGTESTAGAEISSEGPPVSGDLAPTRRSRSYGKSP